MERHKFTSMNALCKVIAYIKLLCRLSSHDVDLNAAEEYRVIFRVAILVLFGLNA